MRVTITTDSVEIETDSGDKDTLARVSKIAHDLWFKTRDPKMYRPIGGAGFTGDLNVDQTAGT
jgi:hypothetical protein